MNGSFEKTLAQLHVIGDVAVVRHGETAGGQLREHRLHVADHLLAIGAQVEHGRTAVRIQLGQVEDGVVVDEDVGDPTL